MTRPLALRTALASLIAVACAAPEPGTAASGDSARGRAAPRPAPGAGAPDSVLLARFQAFLDSAVATRRDSSDAFVGRPERCEADAIVPPVDYLLAAARPLAVTRRVPDEATVRAELTIVGEDSVSDVGPSRYVRLGVRTDTVEWDMARDSAGEWGPCGYASTQRDLGRMGDRELAARWTPPGAGWGRVAALVDSVRRSLGLVP